MHGTGPQAPISSDVHAIVSLLSLFTLFLCMGHALQLRSGSKDTENLLTDEPLVRLERLEFANVSWLDTDESFLHTSQRRSIRRSPGIQ